MSHAEPARAPTEIDLALLDVIKGALEPHGDGVAVLVHVWGDSAGMWFVETTPTNTASAGFSAAFNGDDLVAITVGETSFEVFPVERVDGLEYVGEIASAVFSGNLVEHAQRGFARLTLSDGRVAKVGAFRLPLPWRHRRTRTYAPYQEPAEPS